MPTNGHASSSQIGFSPRQSTLTHPYGHVFSSRTPALRAALAAPSAVRPNGLGDARVSFSQTTVVRPVAPVDGERPRGGGWQDKGALRRAPQASPQPAPDTNGVRSSLLDSARVRSQNQYPTRERLERSSIWMRPGVKSTMQRLAKQDSLSFSAACAEGLEVYARSKLHDQEEALFEPRMQAMMRREIRASDNRHVPFEIKNAIAAEQTRILTADLYKRILLKEGVPLKEIEKKLDQAYNLARSNVLNTRSPKFKNLLAAWWQTTEDLPDRQAGQASDNKDHTAGSTAKGEAGTG